MGLSAQVGRTLDIAPNTLPQVFADLGLLPRNGRGRTFLNVFPSVKAQARAREKLRELTGRHRRSAPIPEVIDEVNRWLAGWGNYFRHGHPGRVFAALNCFVQNRMRRHLQRRSQRHLRPPEGVSFYAYL